MKNFTRHFQPRPRILKDGFVSGSLETEFNQSIIEIVVAESSNAYPVVVISCSNGVALSGARWRPWVEFFKCGGAIHSVRSRVNGVEGCSCFLLFGIQAWFS